ncbi:ferritin-like domain-containing protein [Bacillus sp. F19]|nr:ferritin-like domain-containing protein [Bacillus sp. F19]
MNKLDKLHDIVETEIADQMLYNKYMLQITNSEVRQLFTQLRDEHMQHVTQLQQQIQQLKKNPNNLN